MMKKKKYIKPIIEVIRVHICCQMLSGSGGTFHDANTGKDRDESLVGGGEKHDGNDGLDAVKINYWELENTALGVNN